MPTSLLFVSFLILIAAPTAARASAQLDIEAVRERKRVAALRIDEPIKIDGVLDEPSWERAEPATDFFQQLPLEFAPETRATEVRFLYDSTTLYVGATLHDEAVDRLIVNDLKRDFTVADGDTFGVILDPFLDRRNAYGFLTNPGGAQREAQAYDSGGRTDANWNGVWFVKTAVHRQGWSVEIAIPFKTLRFPDRSVQEWGLNLVRVLRRENERTTWAPVPRQFSYYNVAYAGVLTGISNISGGRSLHVKPFVTSGVQHAAAAIGAPAHEVDGGIDLKWGVASGLVLDATYRTDFSQVEADEQQINLTRFSLFFPEKREFFLENPAAFQIGIAERDNREPRRDLVPFFSRRIGLSPTGEPIPVSGGVRLTGRAGRQGIGFLRMQTRGVGPRPAEAFSALRLTRDLTARASAGMFYFGREAAADDFSRVGGVDIRFNPSRTLQFEAFAMSSRSSSGGDWAGQAGMLLDGSKRRMRAGVMRVGESFRHDMGFIRRTGVTTGFVNYAHLWRRDSTESRVREHSLGFDADLTIESQASDVLTRVMSLNYGAVFPDGAELKASLGTSFERLRAPFQMGGSQLIVAPGEYHFEEAALKFQSNKSAVVSVAFDLTAGEFWDGRRRHVGVSTRLRQSAKLAVQASVGRSWIDLSAGSYEPTLLGSRLDYSFTPRMFLNAFIQYNGGAETWLSTMRLNVIHRPLSDLYLVWNETRLAGTRQRAVLLKYTHLIAF